jgi:hypothetical protein
LRLRELTAGNGGITVNEGRGTAIYTLLAQL